MTIDVEDVKRISLGPNDILWVKLDDASMSDVFNVQKSLRKMLDEAGRPNKVVVTNGEVDFQVISSKLMPDGEAVLVGNNGQKIRITNIDSPKCDCGGEKTGGGHVDYCSTRRKP